MVEVTQADREAAEKFVVDLRCDMSGTQIHNLAGLLASTRIQSTADLQAKLDKAVAALADIDKEIDSALSNFKNGGGGHMISILRVSRILEKAPAAIKGAKHDQSR